MATGGDWRRVVLGLLGAPANTVTLSALTYWAQSEGLPGWYNNWLATFRQTTGWQPARTGFSPPYYPTLNQGAMATANTIAQSNMAPILRALQAGTTLQTIYAAVNRSPWCGGCQTGRYPIDLATALGPLPATSPRTAGPVLKEITPAQLPSAGTVAWAFANLAQWVEVYSVDEYNAILSVAQALGRY